MAPWMRSSDGVRSRELSPGLELCAWKVRGGWLVEVFGERLEGLAPSRAAAKAAAEAAARRRLLDALRELRGTW